MSGFFKSLNTHITSFIGLGIALAGFLVQPQVTGLVLPLLPTKVQGGVATALNIIGMAITYFGRPVTIQQTKGDLSPTDAPSKVVTSTSPAPGVK
jgi:hypothetical protein